MSMHVILVLDIYNGDQMTTMMIVFIFFFFFSFYLGGLNNIIYSLLCGHAVMYVFFQSSGIPLISNR